MASEIATHLKLNLGNIHFEPFPDHESSLQILDNVRGSDVFVLQTIAGNPDHFLMELLIMIDALKRASAKSITAVIPYFGYARQDRKDKPRTPITAKLIANLLTVAGLSRVVTMDLHASQIEGFFDIPVDHLTARLVLCHAIERLNLKNFVVLAPDLGAIKKARSFAEHLHGDFALIDKRRIDTQTVEVYSIIGDVSGKDVVIVDDMCSTGSTLVSAAEACKEKGANKIYAAFTHGILVGGAVERLEKSSIEKIFMTNTVPFEKKVSKIESVSVGKVFADAIHSIHNSEF